MPTFLDQTNIYADTGFSMEKLTLNQDLRYVFTQFDVISADSQKSAHILWGTILDYKIINITSTTDQFFLNLYSYWMKSPKAALYGASGYLMSSSESQPITSVIINVDDGMNARLYVNGTRMNFPETMLLTSIKLFYTGEGERVSTKTIISQ